MDATRHLTVLGAVTRQLEQLLDESAGQVGQEATLYRSELWASKAHVRAATEALRRMA